MPESLYSRVATIRRCPADQGESSCLAFTETRGSHSAATRQRQRIEGHVDCLVVIRPLWGECWVRSTPAHIPEEEEEEEEGAAWSGAADGGNVGQEKG